MSSYDFEQALLSYNAWKSAHNGFPYGFFDANYKLFNFNKSDSFRKAFNREKKRRSQDLKPQPKKLKIDALSTDRISSSEPITDASNMTDLEILRTRYGLIQPTLHKSDMPIDDWIDEYITYDYYTYEPEAIAQLKKEWRTDYLNQLRTKIWILEELLALLPRGYGKTETMLALFIKWFLEIREPLYIVAPSYNHNKNLLRRMERLLKSPSIRRKYGDIIGKISYDKEMLTIQYPDSMNYIAFDPPLSMVTWGSAKEGPHPAWIHFEDVMQKEYKNIESNEDIKSKYTKTFAKMRTRRGGKRTKITITGTRYGLEDFYSYMMDQQKIPVLHKRALEDDGKTMLLCPNYTLDDLQKEREKDPASFETSMNNNPVPSSGLYFNKDDWVSGPYDLKHEHTTQYYIVVDPARGVSLAADNTTIIIYGIFEGSAYIYDGFVGKIDDDLKEKKVKHFYEVYNPVNTVIEDIFALIDMNRFASMRGVIPFKDTMKKAKYIRINAMKSYFVDGLIKVKEGIQPYDFLYNEYLSYNELPSTASRKDDCIDNVSIFIQLFGQYLEKYAELQTDWSQVPDFHLTS